MTEHIRVALEEDRTLSVEALARSGVWALGRDTKRPGTYAITHVPTGRCLRARWSRVEDGCAALAVLGARAPEWARDATFGATPDSPLPACVMDLPVAT